MVWDEVLSRDITLSAHQLPPKNTYATANSEWLSRNILWLIDHIFNTQYASQQESRFTLYSGIVV